jgi:DNA transformation protein and related proteins
VAENTAWYADLFAPWGHVSIKRMFGGLGIYREGLMFALVAYDQLYLKVDDVNRPLFEKAGGKPFTYDGKGEPVTMSYWTPPSDFVDDEDVMRIFADAAYGAALRAKTGKGRKGPSKRNPVERA